MGQQDFLEWAATKIDIGDVSATSGKLDLGELPPDLRLAVRDVQALHRQLNERLPGLHLVLTDNRRRMVSVKKRKGYWRMRLHHMFVGCEEPTLDALADLASGGETLRKARAQIKDYIDRNRDAISFDVDAEEIDGEGEHHDLVAMLDKWREKLGDSALSEVVITWGRYGRGQRTIRFGSYDFDRNLIRIHPALDQRWVPAYFVEFVVYHELLHALYPPQGGASRRVVHTDEFRRQERAFPRYQEAMIWERNNLARFMER